MSQFIQSKREKDLKGTGGYKKAARERGEVALNQTPTQATLICHRTWEMGWRFHRAHRCLPIQDLWTRAHSNKYLSANTRATD